MATSSVLFLLKPYNKWLLIKYHISDSRPMRKILGNLVSQVAYVLKGSILKYSLPASK